MGGRAKMAAVTAFRAADGTELACHLRGEGVPLVCLPGGPMRDSAYLGDLGGLSARRRLVLLDLRGTGRSAIPADPASYRCDRLADDVRALQDQLGLDRADVLGHSAGASLAILYAAAHPHRVSSLVLVTPSTRAVGLDISAGLRREVISLRRGEPWFAEAIAAFERIQADGGSEADWTALAPVMYGRWDASAQALEAAHGEQSNQEAAAVFAGPGAFDPPAVRAALAAFGSPVLLLAGELDATTPPQVAAEFAALFPQARLVVQPGAGHYPWLDDPGRFTSAVADFLGEAR